MRWAALIGGIAYIVIPILMLLADRSVGTFIVAGLTFIAGVLLLILVWTDFRTRR